VKSKPGEKSEGPIGKIVVAVVIALLVGGSSPWWWDKLHPPEKPVLQPPECSPESLRVGLLGAGPDKPAVIKSAARTMRERFRNQNLDCVSGLAAVLLQDDQDNGHGLYYSGEVWRVKAKLDPARADFSRDRMREHFFRYIASEQKLAPGERDGDGAACYQRQKGYCAERTAWIDHLMALDYYQQGQDVVDTSIRIQRLRRASEFVESDLKFGGFDQILPSLKLKRRIAEDLRTLGGL